jgi:hypothetical protein
VKTGIASIILGDNNYCASSLQRLHSLAFVSPCYESAAVTHLLGVPCFITLISSTCCNDGRIPLCASPHHSIAQSFTDRSFQLDKLVGLAMLMIASAVFLYYSVWTLLMVWALVTIRQPICAGY